MKSQEWKRIKREGAESRKAEYDKLTPQQKLDQLDKLGFAAKRQRARLHEIIRQASLAKPKVTETGENVQKIQKDKARKHNLELAEKPKK